MKANEPDIFHLNKFKLDEEWLQQPRLYRKYAERLADARRDHEQEEAKLELVEAELDKSVRSDPAAYGIDKVSESAIKHCIVADPKYQQQQQAAIDSRHKVNVLTGWLTALDHRKKALEKEVDLFLAGYFAEPKAGKSSREQVEQMGRDAAFGKRVK
jgi:hypothetical protein